MAANSSHRLTTGKVKLTISAVSLEIFDFFPTNMIIELSSTFHMTFAQTTEFDWLPGRQKG